MTRLFPILYTLAAVLGTHAAIPAARGAAKSLASGGQTPQKSGREARPTTKGQT